LQIFATILNASFWAKPQLKIYEEGFKMNLKKIFAMAVAGTMALSALMVTPVFASDAESDAGIEFVLDDGTGIFPDPDPCPCEDPDDDDCDCDDCDCHDYDEDERRAAAFNIFFGIRDILRLGSGNVNFTSLDEMSDDNTNLGYSLTEEISALLRNITMYVVQVEDWQIQVSRTEFVYESQDVMGNAQLSLLGTVGAYVVTPGTLLSANQIVTDAPATIISGGLGRAHFSFSGALEMPVNEVVIGEPQTVITWEFVTPITTP